MDLDSMRVDRGALEEGVWLSWSKSRFLVASTRSEAYIRAVERWARTARARDRRKGAEPEEGENAGADAVRADRELAGIWADTLLLDWRGVTSGHGTVSTPYTREDAIRALVTIPDFADWLFGAAQNVDNFRAESALFDGAEPEAEAEEVPAAEDEGAEAPATGKAQRRSSATS